MPHSSPAPLDADEAEQLAREAVAILDQIHDDLRPGPAGAGPVGPGQGGGAR